MNNYKLIVSNIEASPNAKIDLYYDRILSKVKEVKIFDSGAETTTEFPLDDFDPEIYGNKGYEFEHLLARLENEDMRITTNSHTLIEVRLCVEKSFPSKPVTCIEKTYYVWHDYEAGSYCSLRPSDIWSGDCKKSLSDYQTLTEHDFLFQEEIRKNKDEKFFLLADFEELLLTEGEVFELCDKFKEQHDEEYAKRIKEEEISI